MTDKRTKRTYVGFTEDEYSKIENFADQYNFPTISEFIRQAVREKIRSLENPQMYQNNTMTVDHEKTLEEMLEAQKLLVRKQEILDRKFSAVENVIEGFKALRPLIENGITKENRELKNEKIYSLLKGYDKELKPKKISELTSFTIDTVLDIISTHPDLYKTTKNGGITIHE